MPQSGEAYLGLLISSVTNVYLAGGNRESLARLLRAVIVAAITMTLFTRVGHGLNPDRSISQYAHSAWRLQDGLIEGAPNTITQTTDGYIWIGTSSGVARFDGVRFSQWSPPGNDELSHLAVLVILGTSDGSLWIGTQSGGVFQWKNGTLTTYVAPNNEAITAIVEKEKGSVWFARLATRIGTQPICEAGEGRIQCYDLSNELDNQCCEALAKGANGDVWIGGMSLIRWQPPARATAIFRMRDTHADAWNIGSIVGLPDGSSWLGVTTPGLTGGLQHYVNGKWSHFRSAAWDSSGVGIESVLFDSHGALWAGSINKGLYRIWNGKVDHFDTGRGLSDDRVMSLFEDHEGDIWITTREGVDCFRDLAVTVYSSYEGLRAAEFDTVIATRDGTVWAGGDGSLDQVREGRDVLSITGKNLPGQQITSLLEDSQGRMWVGIDQTLNILHGKRFSEIKRPDGQSLGMIVGITEGPEGTVWAEATGKPRRLFKIMNDKVTQVLPAPEMPAARKVAADAQGVLWLGLIDGDLARYKQGKLDILKYQGMKESYINEVRVDADGSVLGATEYGLIGWRKGTKRMLTTRNGLPCNAINTFIRDEQHAMWLYTQCGLIQISNAEFEKWWTNFDYSPKFRAFNMIDGMQPGIAPFQKAARGSDGKLWFVNQKVLQMIDPAHLPTNRISPPVHVEELIAAGKSYSPGVRVHLAPSTRDISIRYTALSYVAPQKVFFRYLLEGQDRVWQDAGTRREAFYTNLRPGPYRFRVIACNNDGLWNQVGDSFSFTITPAYYQTLWFEILCVLLLAFLLCVFYLIRLRQITLQIQGRLGARMEERERIARELHDTLLQGFQGLILRFQGVMKTLPADQISHKMLEAVLDRADEVLFEGRQSVRDLRDKGCSGTELPDLLSRCGEELALGHSSRFSLAVIGEARSIDPIVFDESYRIAREALINAFQHSQATNIEVEITYNDTGVWIRIRDDGTGMDAGLLHSGRRGHWGLSGMRERAAKIGAQLSIWSGPGAGTEVELTIPARVSHSESRARALLQRIKRAVTRNRETIS